jgi:hypothetical protein
MYEVLLKTISQVMKKIFFVFFLLISSCSYPTDQTIHSDFSRIAKDETPPYIIIRIQETYRGDGDEFSFSQIVKFSARSIKDVSIDRGWLSGTSFLRGETKKDGMVELIYESSPDGKWILSRHGITELPK